MRKGFTLIKALVLIMVFPIVMFFMTRLTTTIIRDIPASYRIIQTNTSVLNILEQMRRDVESAEALPESFGEYTTNDQMLLIASANGMIGYQLEDDKIVRRRLTNAHPGVDEDTIVWPVPNAKVQWRLHQKGGDAFAVEVKTCIEQRTSRRLQEKMANSHLYFVVAFGESLR